MFASPPRPARDREKSRAPQPRCTARSVFYFPRHRDNFGGEILGRCRRVRSLMLLGFLRDLIGLIPAWNGSSGLCPRT